MKFKISPSYLLSALTKLSRAVPSNASLPILENILFNVKEDKQLELTASDTELTIRIVLTVDECDTSGCFAVPARILTGLLKEIPELPVELSIADEDKMSIEWFGGASVIPVFNAMDYPEIPFFTPENCNSVTMPADLLVKCLQKTHKSTSCDPIRPVIECVLFDIQKDGMNVVSTDSRQLIVVSSDEVKSDTPVSFLLHRKSAATVCNVFDKTEGNVTVCFNPKYVGVVSGDTVVMYRSVVDKYPNYLGVIPTSFAAGTATVNKPVLVSALRRVGIFNNRISGLIVFDVEQNNIKVSGRDLGFATSAEETVPCSYDGAPITIGFNDEKLNLLLPAFDKEEIRFGFNAANKSVLVTQEKEKGDRLSVQGLIMPVITS